MDAATTGFDQHNAHVSVNAPRDGDVVVTRNAKGRFAIYQVPGTLQVDFASRDSAVEVARGFARRHAVDVWTNDGGSTTRLHRHRPVTDGGQPSPAPFGRPIAGATRARVAVLVRPGLPTPPSADVSRRPVARF